MIRFDLSTDQIPTAWYNALPDLPEPMRGNLLQYSKTVIASYAGHFPQDATTMSCSLARFPKGRQSIDESYAAVGLTPSFYDIHFYNRPDQDEAALISKRVSSSSDLLPGDLLESLEDLVDRLREEGAASERAKDALRAARPGEEIATPGSPETPPADPAVELRQELRRRLEVLRAAADEAAKAIQRASADAIALVENAALSPPDEVERLRAENAELRRQLGAPTTTRPAGRRRPKTPDAG